MFCHLLGLIAAPLNKKLGWRCVAILGAIISAAGFALSSIVPDIYYLYVTYGLITGQCVVAYLTMSALISNTCTLLFCLGLNVDTCVRCTYHIYSY